MKWSKRLIAMLACLLLLLGAAPVSASANAIGSSAYTEPEYTEPATDGLTPEGNLTLVDDIQDSATGKEFLTVVTKNGNYFYLIIDRDADGNATVHFLNLVDEADLLALLSEEEVQEYQQEQTAQPAVPEETEPQQTQATEPAPTEPSNEFDPQMDRETMIMLALPMVVLIVGGFAAYFVFGRKKPKAAPAPQEDTDDWDYDLPEEDDDAPNDY